jgi:DNA-binding NarL/FixJ family response regulator
VSEMMSVNNGQQIYTIWHSKLQQEVELQGGILILADMGVAFQGLLQAAQQCFPKLEVVLSGQLPEDDGTDLSPRIILIHAFFFRNVPGIVAQCRERFPGTPVALMVDDAWSDVPGLRALVAERLVQGLLPLNMQINVWLATVWLLLNGGEYFPSAALSRPGSAGYLTRVAHGTGLEPRIGETGHTAERVLSTREAQVLELMSEGLQNKLIAAKMELSEHTVKVHVHNIIRKLKVHNRTQAAAVYRSYDRPQGFGQADNSAAPGWLDRSSLSTRGQY